MFVCDLHFKTVAVYATVLHRPQWTCWRAKKGISGSGRTLMLQLSFFFKAVHVSLSLNWIELAIELLNCLRPNMMMTRTLFSPGKLFQVLSLSDFGVPRLVVIIVNQCLLTGL